MNQDYQIKAQYRSVTPSIASPKMFCCAESRSILGNIVGILNFLPRKWKLVGFFHNCEISKSLEIHPVLLWFCGARDCTPFAKSPSLPWHKRIEVFFERPSFFLAATTHISQSLKICSWVLALLQIPVNAAWRTVTFYSGDSTNLSCTVKTSAADYLINFSVNRYFKLSSVNSFPTT